MCDPIDVGIIRLLSNNSRESFERIGEKLRVSGNTVSSRVDRLLEQSVISAFVYLPRFSYFGYALRVEESRGDRYFNPSTLFVLESLDGTTFRGIVEYVGGEKVSREERAVARELALDSRKNLYYISRKIGIKYKRVVRVVEALGKKMVPTVLLNLEKLRNCIPYYVFSADYHPLITEAVWRSPASRRVYFFALVRESFEEVGRDMNSLRDSGINFRVVFPKRAFFNFDKIREMVYRE